MATHSERVRVTWNDTDASGRIHFSRAFWWAEAAEVGWFRKHGIDPREAIDYPRRHVEAEYLHMLGFDDELEVRISPGRIGTTSLTFEWEVIHDGEIAVRGRHTIVHVDDAGRPVDVPDTIRRLAEAG